MYTVHRSIGLACATPSTAREKLINKSDCIAQCLRVLTLETDYQGSNPSSYHLLDLELRKPSEL